MKRVAQGFITGALVAFAAVGFAYLMSGCGGAASPAEKANQTLNAISDVANPIYGGTLNGCQSLQEAAVTRATARDEAVSAVAAIRARCDVLVREFERLRQAQLVARDVIAAFEAGESTQEDLDAAVAAVGASWVILRQLLDDLEVF